MLWNFSLSLFIWYFCPLLTVERRWMDWDSGGQREKGDTCSKWASRLKWTRAACMRQELCIWHGFTHSTRPAPWHGFMGKVFKYLVRNWEKMYFLFVLHFGYKLKRLTNENVYCLHNVLENISREILKCSLTTDEQYIFFLVDVVIYDNISKLINSDTNINQYFFKYTKPPLN